MMTQDEMRMAVCEKLPELFLICPYDGTTFWKFNQREINWPTEGLQACHEGTKLLLKQGFEFNITFDSGYWIVSIYQMDDPFDIEVKNKDLLAAWLEALCRVWWPERFV